MKPFAQVALFIVALLVVNAAIEKIKRDDLYAMRKLELQTDCEKSESKADVKPQARVMM